MSHELGYAAFLSTTPKPSRSFGIGRGGKTYDRNYSLKKKLSLMAHEGIFFRDNIPSKSFMFPEHIPLRLDLMFFHIKPKCNKSQGMILKATIPDIDNCIYLVMNALKNVIFPDDKQISILSTSKWFHPQLEGILIKVTNL